MMRVLRPGGRRLVLARVGVARLRRGRRPERAHPVRVVAGGIGRSAHRLVGRVPSSDEAASDAGGALVAAALGLIISPIVSGAAALVAWRLPAMRRARAVHRERALAMQALPETIDLLRLCLDAGLTVPIALELVGHDGTDPARAACCRAAERIVAGARARDALDALRVLGDDGVRCADALEASVVDGAPVSVPLGSLAAELRDVRRRDLERRVRRVPVLLLPPLVLCILPAFALMTVVPLIVLSLRSLQL